MLISRDLVLALLGLDESQVDRVDLLIDWIKDRAELIIGRKLEQDSFEWILDGTGSNKIKLPVAPIVELSALYIDASRVFDDAEDSDDYRVDLESGVVTLFSATTPKLPACIKVVATAGYTEDTLPSSLKMAFLEAISWNMNRMNDRAFGVSNHSAPDGVSVGYEMVLPLGVQRVFEAYREVRI